MAREKVLLIEDEKDIQELVRYNLTRDGFEVSTAFSAEEGIETAATWKPDMILLDLMLPGMDGLEACRVLKHGEQTSAIPVIMVTAKGEESDIVLGLEIGADDYIVKPFSPKVLVARVRRSLRRAREDTEGGEGAPIEQQDIYIHPGRREVRAGEESISLTFTEFNILLFLARRPGWVFTRTQIVDAVKGDDYHVTDRAVDVHILGLRKKLGDHGDVIETVRGVGYRFKE
ncbi:MAG: response regulator transcription factor [bacterium]|nr:response regulator transcription factor [bacterium]MDT8395926.1 response regulator transcription factor [bacterium]